MTDDCSVTLVRLAGRYSLDVRYERTLTLNECACMRLVSSALIIPARQRRSFEPTAFLTAFAAAPRFATLLERWCALCRPDAGRDGLTALTAAVRPADFDPVPGREAYATMETLLSGPIGPIADTSREAALGLFAHLSLSVSACWCWAPDHSTHRLTQWANTDTGDARFAQFVLLNLPQRWVTQVDFLWQPRDARQLRLVD